MRGLRPAAGRSRRTSDARSCSWTSGRAPDWRCTSTATGTRTALPAASRCTSERPPRRSRSRSARGLPDAAPAGGAADGRRSGRDRRRAAGPHRSDVHGWLAACVPQEIGAVTRFHEAARVALDNPARALRGDACELLPEVLDAIAPGPLVYLVDTYVNVFFSPARCNAFGRSSIAPVAAATSTGCRPIRSCRWGRRRPRP